MEQFSYTKENLEKRLECIQENGKHIQKCLEYAIEKLSLYFSDNGIKGLIVDDAMFDLYAKLNGALKTYTDINNRATKKINAKLEDLNIEEQKRKPEIDRFPRRNI